MMLLSLVSLSLSCSVHFLFKLRNDCSKFGKDEGELLVRGQG